MIITTNMPALNAWGKGRIANSQVSKSLEKLSSGYRIGRAADDAAGLGISEKMRAQISGLNRSGLNVADGMSLLNTADGALGTLNDMFKRADELCLAAANGTIGKTERDAISAELEEIFAEVDRISQGTKFNEIPIFQYTKTLTNITKVLEDVNYSTTMNPLPNTIIGGSQALTPPVKTVPAKLTVPYTLPTTGTLADVLDGQVFSFQSGGVNKTFTFTTNTPPAANEVLIPYASDPVSPRLFQTALASMLTKLVPEMQNITYSTNASGNTEVTFLHAPRPGNYLGKSVLGMQSGNGAQISGMFSGTLTGTDGVPLNTVLDFSSLATPADVAALHQTSFTVDCGTCTNIISRVIFLDSTKYTGPPIANTTVTGSITTHNLVVDISAMTQPEELVADIARRWNNPHYTGFVIDPADPKKLVTLRNDLDSYIPAFAKSSTQTLNWTKKEWVDKPANSEVESSIDIFVASLPYQEFIPLRLPHLSAEKLSLSGGVSINTAEEAFSYLDKIQKADQIITTARANLGADYNRLACTTNNLEVSGQNMQEAESRIRDLDMAKEYTRFTATNLIAQAAQAMLAQASQQPQQVLQLLRQ